MKKSISYYFGAAFIMLLGLIYNVIEQDFLGSGIFLVSSIVFLSIGILRKRSFSKSNNVA
jgi:membrane-bound ClpP family serine protease